MKVKELIEELSRLPQDADVVGVPQDEYEPLDFWIESISIRYKIELQREDYLYHKYIDHQELKPEHKIITTEILLG